MSTRITQRSEGEVEVVALSGVVDHAVSRELQEALLGIVATGRSKMALDLEAVPLLDSSGLGMIVTLLKRLRAAGGNLVLVNVGKPIQSVLKLTRVDKAVESVATEEEAIERLTGG